MNLKKNIIVLFLFILLNACVGSSTGGVFGTGVSVALDPRTLGTQIDDSIMQKNLLARLTLTEKKYLINQVNRFGGNISKTANFIGMERSALHRKIKSIGVKRWKS